MTGSGDRGQQRPDTGSLHRLLALIGEQTGLDPLPLRPGCSPSRLQKLEAELGFRLPDDYRELLSTFNGQERDPELTFPPDGLVFLDDADVIRLWHEFCAHQDDERFAEQLRDEDRVRWVLYHRGRVPIAHNESGGHYLCLDRVPGPRGRLDQLVFNVDEIECVVLENSITDLVRRYLALLESGRLTVRRQPSEYGQGYWFTASGRYVDHAVYRELAASSPS